jgi:GT2 family glycosyltransferase
LEWKTKIFKTQKGPPKVLFLFCGMKVKEERVKYMNLKKILIASPVHQKPLILEQFLASLERLNKSGLEVHYYFIDDNENDNSSQQLVDFAKNHVVLLENHNEVSTYVCNEATHAWNEQLIWKVATFKDRMIHYAKKEKYDYLFFIDSDLLLYPETIEHLVGLEKEIVSEIFWTSWTPGHMKLPQVWMSDQYTMYEKGRSEKISEESVRIRILSFLEKLSKPGVYSVGGLGACTMISRSALEKGVSFEEIGNISLWGEDRHFCVRAKALGIDLCVDTHFPAYHIYRESDLAGVEEFKKNTLKA